MARAKASALETLAEPDCLEGAPHPREAAQLFGHEQAENILRDSIDSGRLHHAWLICGARGLGKATLAWRIARFLLAAPQAAEGALLEAPHTSAPTSAHSLDIPEQHPVARRMRARAEPRLFVLRRGLNAAGTGLSNDIRVDEVRKMKAFFALSSADGGQRVAIIDAADELNTGAANALLKLLEEPPPAVTFLLIAHQPHRLLPTIRSRCRVLRLARLAPDALAQALRAAGLAPTEHEAQTLEQLADGSVGAAFELVQAGGAALYRDLVTLFAAAPGIDRHKALALAESCAGKNGAQRFDLTVTLLDIFLARLARFGATNIAPPEAAPTEHAVMRRLAPSQDAARRWADLAQTLAARARRGKAVNLDPAALVMDSLLQIDTLAAQTRA